MNWQGDHSLPLISICCTSFNQVNYIEETLKGFLDQETEYPFEILIHDDASTDGTAQVIREYEALYPNLIKPIYQTDNQYSKGKKPNPEFNFSRAKGAYIAICEGDDFWTDPCKLQLQVAFLEEHLEYAMCCTNFYVVNEHGKVLKKEGWTGEKKKTKRISQAMVLASYAPKVLTSVFRYQALPQKLPDEYIKSPNGDNFLFAMITRFGDAAFIDRVTGCYRIHSGGIWSSQQKVERYTMQLATFYQIRKHFDRREEQKAINTRVRRIGRIMIADAIENKDIQRCINAIIGLFKFGPGIYFFSFYMAIKSVLFSVFQSK